MKRRTWTCWASGSFLLVGAASLLVYFWTIPEDGPAHPGALWTLMFVPVISGLLGVVFGVLARAWCLVALNVLLVLAFPLVMFVGTVVFGP